MLQCGSRPQAPGKSPSPPADVRNHDLQRDQSRPEGAEYHKKGMLNDDKCNTMLHQIYSIPYNRVFSAMPGTRIQKLHLLTVVKQIEFGIWFTHYIELAGFPFPLQGNSLQKP